MGDTLTLAPAPVVAAPAPTTTTAATPTPILPDLKAAVTAAVTSHVSTVQSQASAVLTSLSSGVVAPATLASLLPDLKTAVVNAIDTHVAAVTAQASGVEASLVAKITANPVVADTVADAKAVAAKTEALAKIIEADAANSASWVGTEFTSLKTEAKTHPAVMALVVTGLVGIGYALHGIAVLLHVPSLF